MGAEESGVNASEAAVLTMLLKCRLVSDQERVRESGLPRTTFLNAKRRLYARKMVRDCYLPNPVVFGRPIATVILARPFADELGDISSALSGDPAVVLQWLGRTSILAVRLERSKVQAEKALSDLTERLPHRLALIHADLTLPTLPSYFDFEGVWARLSAHQGVSGYPRTLVSHLSADWLGRVATNRERRAAAELVRRSPESRETDRGPHLLGPHTLKRSDLRLLQRGLVQWRVFPSLTVFPTPAGGSVQDLVYVNGVLREGVAASEVFSRLVYEARSYPILFTNNESKVLLVGVASGNPRQETTLPGGGQRRGVGEILQDGLREIEVTREPLTSMSAPVDHRYDAIFSS